MHRESLAIVLILSGMYSCHDYDRFRTLAWWSDELRAERRDAEREQQPHTIEREQFVSGRLSDEKS